MRPALLPGDRVVTLGIGRIGPGDLVAVRDPRMPARVLVKRVASTDRAGVTVAGDNPGASTDSRHFGPVPRRLVLGRVVYRYAPAERVGRLSRRSAAGGPPA
jgi:inner membrane protease subunit 1